MKVELSFSPAVRAKEIPLTKAELKKLFSLLAQNIKEEEEWSETLQILGQKPTQLALYFCDDAEMRDFQKRFRKLDRTTDILSFPTREMDLVGVDLSSLGDLIVSLPAVARGARRGKRTLRLELMEVLIHGFLHLLGFDHVGVGVQKAKRMRILQKTFFQKLRKVI